MKELNTSQWKNKIRIAGIVDESIVDGPGIRLTVFTQGCRHNCKGCHNPHTHDYQGGRDIFLEEILEKIKANPLLDGITISGGEPFDQAEACAKLAREAKKIGLNVLVYTGYRYEELLGRESCQGLLEEADILIDGKFEIDKKNPALEFRGSSNQRILWLRQEREAL